MAGAGKSIETAAMPSKLAASFARLRAALPAPPRAWVELRCARRLQRMHARIARMQEHPTGAGVPASDADGALRRMLAGLRAELARMRCDLALWHVRACGGRCGTRLAAALVRRNRIAVATHAAAQRLEAELEARAR